MKRLFWRLTRGRAALAFYRAGKQWSAHTDSMRYYFGGNWSADAVEFMRSQVARPDTVIPVSNTYRHGAIYGHPYVANRIKRRSVRWPAAQWVKA